MMTFDARKGKAVEENLLGHLLKANDPTTQADVERILSTDATARQQLQVLSNALAPLATDNQEFTPPPDLFVRTISRVAEHIVRTEAPESRPSVMLPSVGRPKTKKSPVVLPSETLPSPFVAKRRTIITTIGLAIAGLALVFPAIVHVRSQSQLMSCQNNLRQFHQGLVDYSQTNNNQFPQVKDDEPVLTVGRVMAERGYLPVEVMNCPIQTPRTDAPIVLAGYAYSLGYRDGQELRGLARESQNDLMPILADAPNRRGPESIPVNHRHGQNVLFIGGHVRFCTTTNVGVEGDNIYCNTLGEVAAGLTRWDSVLGRPEERP